jgi:GNAT superfamily N-acetyltransferase
MNIALRHRRIDTSAIEIRLASVEDIPALVELFGEFFAASQWPPFLTFDPERAVANLNRILLYVPHICAFDDGKLIAAISYHLDKQYTDPIAVMDETYVRPPYGRTNLARKMVALAIYLAKHDGAKVFNFPLASGMKETASYMNLLRKFGAVPCGIIMRVVL